MISRKQLVLIMVPFILLAAFFYLSLRKDTAISFTSAELEVYRYTTGSILKDSDLKKRQKWSISPTLSGPFYVAGRNEQEAARHSAGKIYTLSFILLSENDRRAIINNAFVREGDIFDNRKVSRIEKDKVALTAKGVTTWLELEEQ